MFDPNNNPTTHPELNGKLRRYATGTTYVRTLRTDHEAEAALHTLRDILAETTDKPTTSLIMRRALKTYVAALKARPEAVEREKVEVRRHSHVPQKRKKRISGDLSPSNSSR